MQRHLSLSATSSVVKVKVTFKQAMELQKTIAQHFKKQFPNLTTEKTLELSQALLDDLVEVVLQTGA